MTYRRIRELREDHDLKQRQLAKVLCCSQQTYSDYENGKVDIPTAALIALSRYYQTSTDYLLGLTDIPALSARHTEGNSAPKSSPDSLTSR